jgi:hypothetical protein
MLHLIFGVAGGIVLGVYTLAYIERCRQARNYRIGMALLYPKHPPPAPRPKPAAPQPPPRPARTPQKRPGPSEWVWLGRSVAVATVCLCAFLVLSRLADRGVPAPAPAYHRVLVTEPGTSPRIVYVDTTGKEITPPH